MTTTNTQRVSMTAALIISLFASLGANADHHFTPYAEELNRCVEAARSNTIQSTTRQIRHFVREQGTAGVWATFEIRTELYDRQDGPMVKAVESSCRAHRWNEQVVLEQ